MNQRSREPFLHPRLAFNTLDGSAQSITGAVDDRKARDRSWRLRHAREPDSLMDNDPPVGVDVLLTMEGSELAVWGDGSCTTDNDFASKRTAQPSMEIGSDRQNPTRAYERRHVLTGEQQQLSRLSSVQRPTRHWTCHDLTRSLMSIDELEGLEVSSDQRQHGLVVPRAKLYVTTAIGQDSTTHSLPSKQVERSRAHPRRTHLQYDPRFHQLFSKLHIYIKLTLFFSCLVVVMVPQIANV